jgi:signal transduction histidine kinase
MTRFLLEPFRPRTWRETAWAVLALPIGMWWFCAILSLLAVALGLAVTIVGVPILAGTLLLAMRGADGERALARTLLGVAVPEPAPRDTTGTPLRRTLRLLVSARHWRAVLLLLLLLPLGVAEFVAAVTLWGNALFMLTLPAWWWWAMPDGDFLWAGNRLDTPWEWLAALAIGTVSALLAPWVVRALVSVHVAAMRVLLGPTRGELERASARAAGERDQAVASVVRDRRQLERDLHDGAQARLVALAVDLDRARTRLEGGGSAEEAAGLVRAAQGQARAALAEVRDLARGIHPAVLTDRGLDAALSALAARSPVPVVLSADIEARPPAEVEAAAYFVVAEALTNAARHAGATEIRLRAETHAGTLTVRIEDDGVGGAAEDGGSGLAGLRERVASLGGTLSVSSPAGAGTTVTATFRCA